ncbi:permease-like cell division protein FtsX [Reichenbachiella sp. MALMAid0571]|uniref:cell division protein FtsX n=1 Tax=Reichenbachiella sp. MALMAid0571 TaxID=3143939 RepID=UPI0032DE96C3
MSVKEKKFKKKKLGSYPFVSVIFSITLALFVIGLFGLLVILTDKLTQNIQENVEMQVFLNKDLSNNEVTKISKTLSSKDYVYVKNEIPQVTTITKQEAAKQFIEETGEDFVSFLGDNPLRDVVVLKIKPEFHLSENLAEIKKEIATIRGVYEVTYIENLVNSINENLAKISVVLIGFSLILFLVVAILINNTIKLALFSQRFLIRSMQLVGATSTFIQKPFLIRASLYGFISGVLAVAILGVLLYFANTKIEGLSELQSNDKLLILTGIILVLGTVVGFISTFAAIKKYLKLSLDELY